MRLSALNDPPCFVKLACYRCKRAHHYHPGDLIQLFGDIDVEAIPRRLKCEECGPGTLETAIVYPHGSAAVGLKVRRLVAIKIQRVPVWRED